MNRYPNIQIAICLRPIQNVSQNQSVQAVAIYVSVMITIALLYFWCESYVVTIKHKETIILEYFKFTFP